MKHSARALLAVVLLVGVYVLAAGLAVGMVALFVAALNEGFSGSNAGKVFVVMVIAIVAMGRGLLSRSQADDGSAPGVALLRSEQPRLWAEVDSLAKAVRTRPPDELWLVPEVNAAVAERSKWLGLKPGARRMYLGAPLLVSLTELQLKSVLAHELGHYGGKHTALAGVSYRGQEAIGGVVGRLGPKTILGRVFRMYGRLYMAVSQTVNRRQELEADVYSAKLAGRDTAAAAMREIGATAQAWDFFVDTYVSAGQATNQRPTAIFIGFLDFLGNAKRQEQLAEVRANPPRRAKSVYDSHPTPAERIARFTAMPQDGLIDQSGPALGLLEQYEEALNVLEMWVYASSDLKPATWAEIAEASTSVSVRQEAAILLDSAAKYGVQTPNLGAILQVLRRGEIGELVQPLLTEDAPPDALPHAAHQLVSSLVASALIDTRGARFRPDWGGPARLVDQHGREIELHDGIDQALTSAEGLARVEGWLAGHAVPMNYRPDPLTNPAPSAPASGAAAAARSEMPQVLAVMAPVSGDGYRYMVILNVGLLLKKPDMGDRMHANLHAYGNLGKAMVKRVTTKRTLDDLISDSKSLVIPWGRVAGVSIRKARGVRTPKYAIALTDGSTLTIKTELATKEQGDPIEVLTYLLGENRVHTE